jgi:hypothetical protein
VYVTPLPPDEGVKSPPPLVSSLSRGVCMLTGTRSVILSAAGGRGRWFIDPNNHMKEERGFFRFDRKNIRKHSASIRLPLSPTVPKILDSSTNSRPMTGTLLFALSDFDPITYSSRLSHTP